MLLEIKKGKTVLNEMLDLIRAEKEAVFPVILSNEERSIEYLEELRTKIDNDRFNVTICGQIKSGKSTLLNAMIFRGMVLPTAVTPETAVLTRINYSKKPFFEAHFYTDGEWTELTNTDNFTATLRENEVEPMPGELMGKVRREENLSNLRDYVAADGSYCYYVKFVDIGYPDERIRDVTFVDTPGLNDPNIVRSKITLDWVGNSDAVLLVLHNQGLNRCEYDFIEDYLVVVPDECFVIALNRIDGLSDLDRVLETTVRAFSHDVLAERNICKTVEDVVPISSLASIFHRIGEHSYESLSNEDEKDMKWHYEKMKKENSELIDDDGGVDVLEQRIENTILKRSGDHYLRSNTKKISLIVKNKLKQLRSEKTAIHDERERVEGERCTLNERIEIIANIGDKVGIEIDSARKKLLSIKTDIKNPLFTSIMSAFTRIKGDLFGSIENAASGRDLREVIRTLAYKYRETLIQHLYSKTTDLHGKIKQANSELINEYSNVETRVSEILKAELPSFAHTILDGVDIMDLDDKFDWHELSPENLKEDISRALGLFWMLLENTKQNIIETLNKVLENNEKKTRETVLNDVMDQAMEPLDHLQESVKTHLDGIRRKLENYRTQELSKKEMLDRLTEELSSLLKKEKRLEDLSEQIRLKSNEILDGIR